MSKLMEPMDDKVVTALVHALVADYLARQKARQQVEDRAMVARLFKQH